MRNDVTRGELTVYGELVKFQSPLSSGSCTLNCWAHLVLRKQCCRVLEPSTPTKEAITCRSSGREACLQQVLLPSSNKNDSSRDDLRTGVCNN